jgi:hypothetical protein
MRAWHGLVERIKQIPVSVVLALAPTGRPIPPPTPRTAKKIAQDLRWALIQPWRRPYFTTHGYTFLVQLSRGAAARWPPHSAPMPALSRRAPSPGS